MVSITSSVEKALGNSGPGWAGIRDAANAGTTLDAITYPANGKDSTNYHIYRSPVIYDTSGIPVGATITQCRFYFFPTNVYNTHNDSIMVLRSSDWSRPSNPIVASDYDRQWWDSSLGSKAIADIIDDAWNYIDLNLATCINLGGSTRYYIVSKKDYDNVGPATNGFNGVYCIDTNKTYLDIAYTLGGKKKVVIVV